MNLKTWNRRTSYKKSNCIGKKRNKKKAILKQILADCYDVESIKKMQCKQET